MTFHNPTLKGILAASLNAWQPDATISPAENLATYTSTRVLRGIECAKTRLNSESRKPSPKSTRALRHYLIACQRYITKKENMQTTEELRMQRGLRRLEGNPARSNSGKFGNTDEWQSIQDDLLILRKNHYYARYASWATHDVLTLKEAEDMETSVANLKDVCGRWDWIEVSAEIKREAASKNNGRYIGNASGKRGPIANAIDRFCKLFDIDTRQVYASIHSYAEVNNVPEYDEIATNLENRRYEKIAELLHYDLQDLRKVMHLKESCEDAIMRKIIKYFRGVWFTRMSEKDSPETWLTKKNLLAVRRKLLKKNEKKRQIEQDMEELVQLMKNF